jgi:hypothetical protein
MATENNKNPVPNNQETGPVVTAGDGDYSSRNQKLPFKRPYIQKRHVAFVLMVLVVLAAGTIVVKDKLHIGEKIYAQAAGHKIYEPDVKQLIGNMKGITYHEAAVVLADKYLTEAMAKTDKISVSSQDRDVAYGKDINTQKNHQKFYYQRKINELYFRKLAAFNKGIYKGEYLIANFGRNVSYPSPLLAEDEAANPNLGNLSAIAADKKYANNFITKLYNQITNHKMSFDQAIKAEHKDPEVGVEAYPTQPHSGSFDTSNGYGSFLTANLTYKKLRITKQGTMTKPFVPSNADNGTIGSYYLVIRMDESRGGSNVSFDQSLKQAKQKYGYKINV